MPCPSRCVSQDKSVITSLDVESMVETMELQVGMARAHSWKGAGGTCAQALPVNRSCAASNDCL